MKYNFDLFQKILIFTEDQRFRRNYSEIFCILFFYDLDLDHHVLSRCTIFDSYGRLGVN